MKTRIPRVSLFLGLTVLAIARFCSGAESTSAVSAEKLQNAYSGFAAAHDPLTIATDYPKAVRNLLSADPEKMQVAFQMLANSAEPAAILWLVPFLNAPEPEIRVTAASAINKIIEQVSLKRRDPAHPEKVALLPRRSSDPDLRPCAWLAYRMFRDISTQSYAATIVRYLELPEFEPELRRCLASPHPAVANAAREALRALDLPVLPIEESRPDTTRPE